VCCHRRRFLNLRYKEIDVDKERRITAARLDEILRRQNPPAFGRTYQPSILPTTAEAPPMSRPAWVKSTDLERKISTLSGPERAATVIALYQPKLFDLQEQRVLPADTAPHPLTGHPSAEGMDLPFF
jgi:hypothetical protein